MMPYSSEPAVLRANEQRAVVVERLGVALNDAVTDVDGDALADGVALVLPFVGNLCEVPGGDARVVAIQFA